MTRYIAKFARGGFPELFEVLDTHENCVVGEPKPYHEANTEAARRNDGTWGQPLPEPIPVMGWPGWFVQLPDAP